jgi:hypothetical protein
MVPDGRADLASAAAPEPPAAPSHSARRLNALIRRCGQRRYLEIGVKAGRTFFAVEIDDKVAVDPRFRFAPADHARPGVAFLAMTSDEYFAALDPSARFDVVFLDGLHVFEQTYRDFRSSLLHAHGTTVWLVDDTIPCDPYSAIPDRARALEARGRTGDPSRAWHGDVYKMIFALHDVHPELRYRTIVGGGNPQTVVWPEPRDPGPPRIGSLEAISRLDFSDLQRHWDLVRAGGEREVLDEVTRFCRRRAAAAGG